MATDEEYNYDDYREQSFIENLKRNLSIVTISDWVMILLVAISILILSGFIFVFAETPEFIGRNIFGTQVVYNIPVESGFNYAGTQNMYFFELLIVAGTLTIGVIGLYLIRNATRFIDDRDKGVLVLSVGVAMFLFALFLLYLLFNFKITGQFPNFLGEV